MVLAYDAKNDMSVCVWCVRCASPARPKKQLWEKHKITIKHRTHQCSTPAGRSARSRRPAKGVQNCVALPLCIALSVGILLLLTAQL